MRALPFLCETAAVCLCGVYPFPTFAFHSFGNVLNYESTRSFLFLLTPNLFMNLEDPSALLQITTQTDLMENMLLLGALNIPVGGSGTEFGGIESGTPGQGLASGPGVFVQFAWYF